MGGIKDKIMGIRKQFGHIPSFQERQEQREKAKGFRGVNKLIEPVEIKKPGWHMEPGGVITYYDEKKIWEQERQKKMATGTDIGDYEDLRKLMRGMEVSSTISTRFGYDFGKSEPPKKPTDEWVDKWAKEHEND